MVCAEFLCFAVMCHHALIIRSYMLTGKWLPPVANTYRLFGPNAVALFFSVTGFLFWSRILSTSGELETWSFLRARWFRIVPLYTFSVIVALAIAAHHIHWHSPFVRQDTLYLLLNMGTDGGWGQIGDFQITYLNSVVTWSLQYEWAFYLSLPVLAPLVRSGHTRRLFLVFAALVLMRYANLEIVCYFVIGIIAAHVYRSPNLAQTLRSWPVTVIVVLCFVLMPLAAHLPGELPRLSRLNAVLINKPSNCANLVLLLIAFVPIACGNSLFGILNLSGLRLMGIVSYSVYLLHGIALYLGRYQLAGGSGSESHVSHVFWLRELTLATAVLFVSLFTYRWIEYPFIRLEKRLRSAPSTAASVKAPPHVLPITK